MSYPDLYEEAVRIRLRPLEPLIKWTTIGPWNLAIMYQRAVFRATHDADRVFYTILVSECVKRLTEDEQILFRVTADAMQAGEEAGQ